MRAEGAAAGVPRAARTPSPAARARPRYRYGVRASMYGRSRCAPPSRSRQSRKCRRSASATQCYLIVVSLLYSRDTRHIGHRPLRLRCGSRARAHGHRPRSQACTRQQTALPLCRHSKIAYAPGPSRAPGPSHAPPSMLPRACCSAATNPPRPSRRPPRVSRMGGGRTRAPLIAGSLPFSACIRWSWRRRPSRGARARTRRS